MATVLSNEELIELASLSGPKLRARVKEMQERGLIPKWGQYAEANADLDTGELTAGFKSWKDSPYYRDKLKAEYKNPSVDIDWNLPPLVKRTERERVESMTKRLMDAIEKQPWEADMILKGVVADSWNAGHPLSFDELKSVVQPWIEQASKTAAEKDQKKVTRG